MPRHPPTAAPLLPASLCTLLSSITEGSRSCHRRHGCVDALCFAGIARSDRRRPVFHTWSCCRLVSRICTVDLPAGSPWQWQERSGSPGRWSSAYPAHLLELSLGASCFSHLGTATHELLCPSSAQGRYLIWKISIK